MYIDTHCHLDDSRFTDLDGVIGEFLSSNVKTVIQMGCDLDSSMKGKLFSDKYSSVYFAVGVHPSEIEKVSLSEYDKLIELSKHNKCVAIGEIGLDYHFEPFDKEKQRKSFIKQIEIANECSLPISVHSRDACKDTLDILTEYRAKKGGVMHCFSGSIETAKTLLDLGFYLGFGGTVTFKNAKNVKEVASFCPADRILTETDSPYLAPDGLRGQTNTPKNIPIICDYLANLKGIDKLEFASIVLDNAKRLFYKLK